MKFGLKFRITLISFTCLVILVLSTYRKDSYKIFDRFSVLNKVRKEFHFSYFYSKNKFLKINVQ